ncbi:MAG: HAMP domain-containing protein [Chitinophagia bacterium]|nr:HAMP domain-containing protein [Chitinophagia bacterium]
MNAQLKSFIYKNGYLIITAAWLYTISFLFINYWSYRSSPAKVKSSLEKRLANKTKWVFDLSNNSIRIQQLIQNVPAIPETEQDQPGIFLFDGNAAAKQARLLYWNTNRMYYGAVELDLPEGIHMVTHRNGEFELIRKNLQFEGKLYSLLALVPIRWNYFIENKYLRTHFAGFNHLEEQYEITDAPQAIPITTDSGQTLFKIQLKAGKEFIQYDAITIILRLLAMLLLLAFLYNIATEMISVYSFRIAFIFLVSMVVFLRWLTYAFHIPFDFTKIPLFDPAVYASNKLHPSLGDLLVNAALLYGVLRFYRFKQPVSSTQKINKESSIINLLYTGLLTFCGLFLAGLVGSLLEDAKISFDVSNFFSLSIFSFISFIVLCLLVLIFFYLSEIWLLPQIKKGIPFYQQIFLIIVVASIFIIATVPTILYGLYACISGWILLYVFLVHLRRKDFEQGLLQSGFFIFWVMFFALSISALVMTRFRQVEWMQREKLAEKLVQQSDPFGENLLNIAATNFEDAFLQTNFYRFTQSENTNKLLKDSLIRQNFSGYLNKYETRILTYGLNGDPFFNEDVTGMQQIDSVISNQSQPTEITDLFAALPGNKLYRYVFKKRIDSSNGSGGYFYVLINPNRYKSEALYPELFNQVADPLTDPASGYAYAVYQKGKLVYHFNNYDFSSEIPLKTGISEKFERVVKNGYTELWYMQDDDKQVMIVRKNNTLTDLLTLFAYLFCSFILVSVIFSLSGKILQTRFKLKQLLALFELKIKSQIQSTIIFISIISFLVIGITTITFFIGRFNLNNEERLTRAIQVMANEINSRTSSRESIEMQGNPGAFGNELEQVITDISEQHNADINYYSTGGNLLISTQPYIYNKKLLSEKMDANAFKELTQNKRIRYLQTEEIGDFRFLSVYKPLKDAAGITYAYLNIPYLNTQAELNQEISGFLATLLNLNAFIFLIAGAIAFYLTNRITRSFELISGKMQQISLGKINEPIVWNRNDELGVLIMEYNKMVKKLEQSAGALAESERELAWKEMARQVAHEIKNPLTPMKLSIQYLQAAIQRGDPNVGDLYKKTNETLITQIDQLSQIAGDFAQFAQISQARLIPIDISSVLQKWVHLHGNSPECSISAEYPNEPAMLMGDEGHLNRLFTNLLLNAIQARQDSEIAAVIRITVNLSQNQLFVAFSDQSGGIRPESIDLIFTPNFTTKTAGTGLGLAISKRIVEQSGGKIRFESVWGKGTTFLMEWPRLNTINE